MESEAQRCYVIPNIRTDYIVLASLLHVFRATIFFAISLLSSDVAGVLTGFGIVEIFIAWWLWSLRLEAWGVSMGTALFHILFPAALGISLIATGTIVCVCIIQCLVLGIIRYNGGYSFEYMANIETKEMLKIGSLQSSVFGLSVVAQFIKTFFVLFGSILLYLIVGFNEPVPWLGFFSVVILSLILGFIDFLAGLGLYLGRDWGFHLTVIMVPVSFVETMLTLMTPIFLIGVWILLLLNTCLAKDGFYFKLLQRRRKTDLMVTPKK